MIKYFLIAAVALGVGGLSGCVVAPGYGYGYGYGYAPAYYTAPAYYYGPSIGVGIGGRWR